MKTPRRKRALTSSQVILCGFAGVILLGTLLLMLPIAANTGESTPFPEALFTSVSAACVTGLVVHDTATHWSMFGQTIILLLIQVGGMGVVTVMAVIAMISGRRIGLMQRSTMQEAISAPQVGGIVRLTGFVVRITLCVELIGAVLLSPVFCRDYGWLRGIWMAVFHSVSAFCNAGFDLLGEGAPFSSMTAYAAHPLVNIVLMMLILFGGIGFLTWDDIRSHGIHLRRYRMQSKVVLTVSAVLILLPAIGFFFVEFADLPLGERTLAALFAAVSPRTAGFNTVDLASMTEAGKATTILLMLVGGSPGSTAGGMKTTTLAVLIAAAVAVFRRRESAQAFGRRIADGAVRHAMAILLLYLSLFLGSGVCISLIEGLPLLTCLFETASAVGTVGLTLGITSQLSILSHILLMFLMFFGRVGGLTLIFAALSDPHHAVSKLPQEKITVG